MLSTLTNLELLKTAEEEGEDDTEEEDAAKTPTQTSSDDKIGGEDAGNEGSGNSYENLDNDLENQFNQQLGIPRSGGGNGGGGVGGGGGGVGGVGGGGGCIQKTKPKPPAHSSKPLMAPSGGLVGSQTDRRTRPPPPPAQSKPPRDLKANSMSSTKHVPDTR